MTGIDPHPMPPPDLDSRTLSLLSWSGSFYRIHKSKRAAFDCPFGGDGRFDAFGGEFSCVYSGQNLDGSFVETALWDTGKHIVPYDWLKIRTLTIFKPSRELQFVDLTAGSSLVRLGADAELSTGRDRHLSKSWSMAFWKHPSKVDGIAYLCRHDPKETAYAIFDRAQDLLEIEAQYGMFEYFEAGNLNQIRDKYNVIFI